MQTLRFNGSGGEFFKIWIVNILLTIVTFGVYYPWAKVRTKRYFYGNTSLNDRNFDYHATGMQIFKGYVIAMIVLVLFNVLQSVSLQAALAVAAIVALAMPWVVWRSLMFNMRVTSFSNVRFSFKGLLKEAYFIFLGIPLLAAGVVAILFVGAAKTEGAAQGVFIAISVLLWLFGWLFLQAFITKKSAEYQLNGTYFGQGKFTTNLRTMKFVGISLKAFGLSIVLVFGLALVLSILAALTIGFTEVASLSSSMSDPDALAEEMGAGMLVFLIFYYLSFFMLTYVIMAFVTTLTRSYIFENTRLNDDIKFRSTFITGDLAGLMITNLLMTVFSLGLATPWAKVRMAKYVAANTGVDAADFDQFVTQQEEHQSALAEQLGEAFDLDIGAVGV